ncbi:MAG: alpha/beta fold hydrolase [Ilumatobacteraceae bacterium]
MRLHQVVSGTGLPLVFVHGLGTSATAWDVVRPLLDDEFTVIALDLLGHGESPVPDDPSEYTRDRMLAEFDELLDGLPQRPVMIGHSLGGYLTLAYAATRPGRLAGIVVENTGPGFRDSEKREGWNERSRRNAHRFGVPVQVTEMNLQHDSVVMDRLPEMDVPTLVLAGGDDRPEYQGSGTYLERKMPDARMVVIPGGGHNMHEEDQASLVADAIRDFVRDHGLAG